MPDKAEVQWRRVQRLRQRWPDAALAVQAYGAIIDTLPATHPDREVMFADYVLHCNAFAVRELEAGRVACAGDYINFALKRFAVLHNVVLDPHAPSQDDETAVLRVTDRATLALLALTLHNQSSLALGAGQLKKARALRALQTACAGAGEVFGQLWDMVAALNAAVWAVMETNFELAEEATRVLAPRLQHACANDVAAAATGTATSDSTLDGGQDSDGERLSAHAMREDRVWLHALCLFTCGIAQQYTRCDAAGDSFALARTQLADAAPVRARLAAVVEAAETLTVNYVAELRAKAEAEMMERQAAQETAHRKPHKTALRARRRSSVSNSGRSRLTGHVAAAAPVIAPPPMHAALRAYIRSHGVPVFCIGVLDLRHALSCLRLGTRRFVSPLESQSTPTPSMRVLAVPVCAETPMAWALEVQRVLCRPPSAATRSVWSCDALSHAPYITAVLAARAAQGPSRAMSLVDDARRPSRVLRTQLAPRPFSERAMEGAQSCVTTAVQLLGQRLHMLLKLERNYEDCWQATRRVKSALNAYDVAQALLRFKRTHQLQQQAARARTERSARIVTRFMRRVAQERPSQRGFRSAADVREARATAAALVLQRYTRRWLARQVYHRLQAERAWRVRQITIVQAVYRRRHACRECERRRAAAQARECDDQTHAARCFAALCIQRVYRGHRTRLALGRAAGAARWVLLHHLHDSRHYYATVIQKRVRGVLVRRVWGAAVQARCRRARNEYRTAHLTRCCIAIQRCYRRHRARTTGLTPRRTLSWRATGQAVRQVTAAEDGAAVRAVVRLQCLCRVHMAKQKAAHLRHTRAQAAAARKSDVYSLLNLSECVF